MADRDYYEVLGVPRDATPDAIKKAYRSLARTHHPDMNPGDKKSEAKFKEAQQAYDILSNVEKRSLYDRYGRAGLEGMAAAGPRGGAGTAHPGTQNFENFDFADFFGQAAPGGATTDEAGGGIFEELMGRMRGGKPRGRPGAGVGPRQGRNLEANLSIPFLKAVNGGETTIEIERDQRRESLNVKIPPGAETGNKLRLAGKGEPGERGALDGDLIVQLTVEPHPYFTRDGRNLNVEVPVSVSEAILGGKVDVPTLNGVVSLPIGPGTSGGQKLRLRGKGIPASGGKPDGDLFVTVKVLVPKNVDDESRRLIQEFADRNPSNPREGLW